MLTNQLPGPGDRINRRTWAGWRSLAAICGCVLLLLSATAAGQVRQIQGGSVLDANPMIGSGGYNAARPVASGINGNLIMSGNVTAGRAFRGFSPIGDPSSLQTTIPSADLSNFVRDSVGLPAIQTGLSPYTPRPYFDLPKTAVSAGAIEAQSLLPRDAAGVYRVGTGQYEMPVMPSGSTQQIAQYARSLPYAAPGWTPAGVGMFNPEILAGTPGRINPNPLAPYAVTGPLSVSQAGTPPLQTAITPGQASQAPQAEEQGRPGADQEFLTFERAQPGPGQQFLARPLAPSSQPGIGAFETEQTSSSLLTQMQQYTTTLRQSLMAGGEQSQQQPIMQAAQGPLDTSVEAAARRPSDELWLLRPGTPEAQRQQMLADAGRQQAAALVESRLRTPIRSLAGTRRTQVDQLLAQAEEQLRKGEYYKAAETYNGVITAAPDNALAWLGRSNALLAAGEYIQAYLALDRGISRFPQMLNFDLDLPSLVGNAEILDVRRAELEKMLAARADYRMQFLLGYMEYFSGVRDAGLQTLQQAARAAPAGSIVQKAYQILAQRGAAASQPAE